MNKKLIGNLFLVTLVTLLALSFFDFGGKARSNEEHISAFIEDNLEPGTKYLGIVFKEVNEPFLTSQEVVKVPLERIKDSIQNQLNLLSNQYLSLDFQNALQKAEKHMENFKLENVKGYLSIDAEVKRTLKKAGGLDVKTKDQLYAEETRMFNAINDLNAALGQYNLSLFSLNFDQTQTIRLYHEYQLTDAHGESTEAAIFELDGESKEVLSFKEIVSVG